MFGSRGRSEATSEGAEHCRAPSSGIDTVEFFVKKLVRFVIAEDFSRQVVDDITENHDIVCAVIVDASSFRNKPPEHPVVTFVRPFFAGSIRMREIHWDSKVFYSVLVQTISSRRNFPVRSACPKLASSDHSSFLN